MRDLPVIMSGYKLTVVEPPVRKTKEDEYGNLVPVTDRAGVAQFVVSLFAKLQVQPGERAPKGEEIRVTLLTDPGEGFMEDSRVELVEPRINAYQMENGGRVTSGISFKALGVRPVPVRGEK